MRKRSNFFQQSLVLNITSGAAPDACVFVVSRRSFIILVWLCMRLASLICRFYSTTLLTKVPDSVLLVLNVRKAIFGENPQTMLPTLNYSARYLLYCISLCCYFVDTNLWRHLSYGRKGRLTSCLATPPEMPMLLGSLPSSLASFADVATAR